MSTIGQRLTMRLLDLTLPDPAENLALDEALLLAAEEGTGPEVLRFWELPTLAVIVGSGGSVAIDVNAEACERDGVPILRRASGGGTVLLGPGCLCYSLVLRYDRAPGLDQIRTSNQIILDQLRAALAPIRLASQEGTSDLAVDGVKISGNAQQRKRTHFLHHGTILCGFDTGLLARYLHAPERQPDYRRNRTHAEFVTNLPAAVSDVKRLLAIQWKAAGAYGQLPLASVQALVVGKYACPEWNRRR